jgi:ribonuclease-3
METYSIGRRDPKSELQERIQQGGAEAPTYRVVGMGGPDHARRFEVEVQVDAVVLGRGDGLSKKSAEMAAARAALEALDRKEKP